MWAGAYFFLHTLTYDASGRITSDVLTTLGSNVDGAVRRIETAYDGQGNAYLTTSYDASSAGNIVNQVQREFNGLGQLVAEEQEHSGAVDGSTLAVQYAYSEMASGANHSRLISITYPSGYVLTFNYSSGLNSNISRLSSLSDSGGTLESFDYLGLSRVVKAIQGNGVQTDVLAGGTPGDGGDQYGGLDRFGRVTDLRWVNTSGPTTLDHFQYGYDQMGNRLYRDNLVNTAFGELYAYDALNQLTSFDRGTLNGTKTGLTGSASRAQDWDYDALGNWDSLTTDSSTQTRSANKQNEITNISGATTPSYDANGNMTQAESGLRYVYDAWNRLVAVKDSPGTTTLKTYSYDGLNRRVTETASGTTTDLFYSEAWQVLEEKVGSNTTKRYVWSPVYVDGLVLRERDTDGNGSLDERLYVQQDANFNVTALVNTSGSVVERYAYDPFGVPTVMNASWTTIGSSAYAWVVLFQGRPFDAISGAYHFRNRDVSPTLGRPIQADMLRFAAGDLNFYRWEANGPVNRLDPNGLQNSLAHPQGQLALAAATGSNPYIGIATTGTATVAGSQITLWHLLGRPDGSNPFANTAPAPSPSSAPPPQIPPPNQIFPVTQPSPWVPPLPVAPPIVGPVPIAPPWPIAPPIGGQAPPIRPPLPFWGGGQIGQIIQTVLGLVGVFQLKTTVTSASGRVTIQTDLTSAAFVSCFEFAFEHAYRETHLLGLTREKDPYTWKLVWDAAFLLALNECMMNVEEGWDPNDPINPYPNLVLPASRPWDWGCIAVGAANAGLGAGLLAYLLWGRR